jgi:hypothetical protein
MPVFRLPLSGNVTQSINPWTWFFNPIGSQFGLVNIELGQSSDPGVDGELCEFVSGTTRVFRLNEEATDGAIIETSRPTDARNIGSVGATPSPDESLGLSAF